MRKAWRGILEDALGTLRGRAPVKSSGTLGDDWAYPTDWSASLVDAHDAFGPFDSTGVPLWRVRGALQYTPSRIAGFALACWSAGDRTPDRAARWRGAAQWFATQPRGEFFYPFDLGPLQAPWLSCIGQGQGISVLCRAHLVWGGDTWLAAAAQAAHALLQPVHDGGVLGTLANGAPFFEEYPGYIPHVLNGCLHAWVGLDELQRLGAAPPGTKALLSDVAAGLAATISDWDVRDWSTYTPRVGSQRPNVNTLNYHIVHAALLTYVGARSGQAPLVRQATQWDRSRHRTVARVRALASKVQFRLAEGW
jgi:hypothetical protein